MSWDIIIQDFPQGVTDINDISDDFAPKMIGMRADLIARIQEIFPAANFSDRSWGVLEGDGYSIEFGMGSDAECDAITCYMCAVAVGRSPLSLPLWSTSAFVHTISGRKTSFPRSRHKPASRSGKLTGTRWFLVPDPSCRKRPKARQPAIRSCIPAQSSVCSPLQTASPTKRIAP